MTFEIDLEFKISAPIEYVFDWWTDLSPDDSTLVKPLKSRQIISRTSQIILLHDEEQMYFKKMSFDVKVSLDRPSKWISEYDGKDARAKSEYVLRSNEDGTTAISYHTQIQPKGFLTRILSPIVRPFVKWVFASEMKIFISALTADFRNGKNAIETRDNNDEEKLGK